MIGMFGFGGWVGSCTGTVRFTAGLVKAMKASLTSRPLRNSTLLTGKRSSIGIFIFWVSTNSASQKPPLHAPLPPVPSEIGLPGEAVVLLNRAIFGFCNA